MNGETGKHAAASQRPSKRRKYILDPQWQLSVFRNTAGVALVAGLAQMLAIHGISQQDPLERWSGEEIGLLALAANFVFLGIVFVGLFVVSVRLTHSVVGPAMVIRRAVDGLLHNQFDHRLSLRKRDYLKSLSSSVQLLSQHLKKNVEAAQALCAELTEALAQDDVPRALQLTERLRALHTPPQDDTPESDTSTSQTLLEETPGAIPDPAIPDPEEKKEEVASSTAGSALLDTLMAVVVLSVGILSASGSALTSAELQRDTASYIQAHNTSRDILEQIRNGDLTTQFQAFSATPNFEVGEQQVSVGFPEDLLLETFGGSVPATARFRDLDSDGEVELDTTSTDLASLLPVRIMVRQNNLRLRFESLLTER